MDVTSTTNSETSSPGSRFKVEVASSDGPISPPPPALPTSPPPPIAETSPARANGNGSVQQGEGVGDVATEETALVPAVKTTADHTVITPIIEMPEDGRK